MTDLRTSSDPIVEGGMPPLHFAEAEIAISSFFDVESSPGLIGVIALYSNEISSQKLNGNYSHIGYDLRTFFSPTKDQLDAVKRKADWYQITTNFTGEPKAIEVENTAYAKIQANEMKRGNDVRR